MKKKLCFFSALALVLISSCSSDDSSSESNDDLVLLKKTITTGSDEDENGTTNYTYDGNRLVLSWDTTNDLNMHVTYKADFITKIEWKDANGKVEQEQTYLYNSDGKIETFIRVEPDNDYGYKEVYTYNSDGTVSVKLYSGNSTSQTVTSGTGTIKFLDGEISQMTFSNGEDHKYTYDSKNNPFKNVLGMDKIAFTDGEADGILHNMLTDLVGKEFWSNSTFTYNENGYPIKEVNTGTDTFGTTEYFY
jgi:hypothetical protein